MKLNETSVKKLCGEAKEAVVFGFGKYQYKELCEEINKLGIKAVHSDDYEYKHEVDKNAPYSPFRYFKFILNDLLIENYKRQQKGEPIIPLLFVVGLNENEYDKKQIAERQDHYDKWVTLTELRRCYKLVSEFGDEITDIAKKTFQFVKLVSKENTYQLQAVDPFWQDEQWKAAWEERKKNPDVPRNTPHKHIFWRETFEKLLKESSPMKDSSPNESSHYKKT
ncbi:hypothetical protein E3983_06145 [Legionella israelensis]|uniref:Uncharacterized protein n=1 Tax=Legionella israelensis TaxID=454 RepID=A0AAX1EFP9_9GAMM|nr:hypothetical protein [Legionella israelensis]QBR83966.1 hypothetical protein E3983_06145 [Legionella israelensis]